MSVSTIWQRKQRARYRVAIDWAEPRWTTSVFKASQDELIMMAYRLPKLEGASELCEQNLHRWDIWDLRQDIINEIERYLLPDAPIDYQRLGKGTVLIYLAKMVGVERPDRYSDQVLKGMIRIMIENFRDDHGYRYAP